MRTTYQPKNRFDLDFESVDELLEYDKFTLPWNYDIEKLLQEIERLESRTKLFEYVTTKFSLNSNNSWVPYFAGIKWDTPGDTEIALYKTSADLGNPFAMVRYADLVKDEKEKEKYLNLAINLGSPDALYNYIKSYIPDELNNLSLEQKDQLRDRILRDIKKFPADQTTESFNVLEPATSSQQEKARCEYLARIYQILNDMYGDNRYLSELLYYQRYFHDCNSSFVEYNVDKINDLILESLKNKAKYEELKSSYEELKKVKQMDFNDIVSSEIGEFL